MRTMTYLSSDDRAAAIEKNQRRLTLLEQAPRQIVAATRALAKDVERLLPVEGRPWPFEGVLPEQVARRPVLDRHLDLAGLLNPEGVQPEGASDGCPWRSDFVLKSPANDRRLAEAVDAVIHASHAVANHFGWARRLYGVPSTAPVECQLRPIPVRLVLALTTSADWLEQEANDYRAEIQGRLETLRISDTAAAGAVESTDAVATADEKQICLKNYAIGWDGKEWILFHKGRDRNNRPTWQIRRRVNPPISSGVQQEMLLEMAKNEGTLTSIRSRAGIA
jgi:hypothetical protein